METLTFIARVGAKSTVRHRVKRVQFGDGYIQRTGDGINSKILSWSLSFTGRRDYIDQVTQFFDSNASRSFQWNAPGHGLGLYSCEQYSTDEHGGEIITLTATLEQAHHP